MSERHGGTPAVGSRAMTAVPTTVTSGRSAPTIGMWVGERYRTSARTRPDDDDTDTARRQRSRSVMPVTVLEPSGGTFGATAAARANSRVA